MCGQRRRCSSMSRLAVLARLLGMGIDADPARRWLTAAILSHLVISIVHGTAHAEAHVPLSRASNLFVFIVIVAGPLAGLALTWPAKRVGSWVIAVTMAGSLVFGLLNHFVFASPDHVAHVARQWQPLFTTTAVLLALTEGLGFGLAIGLARERKRVS
jgi:hypothetical protein